MCLAWMVTGPADHYKLTSIEDGKATVQCLAAYAKEDPDITPPELTQRLKCHVEMMVWTLWSKNRCDLGAQGSVQPNLTIFSRVGYGWLHVSSIMVILRRWIRDQGASHVNGDKTQACELLGMG